MKYIFRILPLFLCLILLSGCAKESTPLPETPERVVVLQASLADLWLTAGGTVIGVTDDAEERNIAPEATVVGTTKSPSTEAILALKPDLVIYSPDIAGQAAAAEVLCSAGIPLLPAKVDSFSDYLFHLKEFTQITGDETAYPRYGESVAAEIENIIAAVPQTGEAPRVLFLRAYSSGAKAKATDHLFCDILDDLGAVNIAASHSSLLENLSLEVIVREDPDFIFVVTMGSDDAAAVERLEETLFSQPLWQNLSAVQEGRLLYLPRELFHFKPNARWAEAYSYVFDILYP